MRGIEMTYEEFKNEVEALGLCIKEKGSLIRIKTKGDYYVADVNKEKEFEICTEPLATLGDSKEKILDLCYQLAKTPLEEREPVKKYLLKFKNLRTSDGFSQYLSADIEGNLFASRRNENLKQEFNIKDLDWQYIGFTENNFDLIEVEE